MSNQYSPDYLDVDNEGNLKTIMRAITLSQGEFSFILLHCNYNFIQQQIFTKLQEIENVKVSKITLLPNIKTLYTNIAEKLTEQLGDEQPQVLMVFGLELVQNIDTVLTLANQVREEFRNNFHFPMLLWVNDQILTKMIRLAPDLKNWATTIDFNRFKNELLAENDDCFRGHIDFLLRNQLGWNLENAHKNLQKLDVPIFNDIVLLIDDPEIKITQEDAQCLNKLLDVFKQAQYTDLVSKYISLLCQFYRNLRAWDELEKLVYESLKIHQKQYTSSLLLAKDYGFLSELALHKFNFNEANNYAKIALRTLGSIVFISKNEYVFYKFLLAKSYQGLGNIPSAISNLETAKSKTNVHYDSQLYIDILNQLNILYFQEKQYLKAFKTKQEKLQIEQQYGFRAFVGASYLNPQRQVINTKLQADNRGTIAQEIIASGREIDVDNLRKRIEQDQYKLTVIHGQSGVGKSSILQGGLIPALQQKPIHARNVLPIILRNYTNWVETLEESLKSNKFNVGKIHQLSLHDTNTIIKQLHKNNENNLLTVLIFDQFEEFFFVYKHQPERQYFYDFLSICLDIPFVKVVLSLREDYLHYLLELERKCKFDLDVLQNDLLKKDNRYYLGNFSAIAAKNIIQSLTNKTNFLLEDKLLDQLVIDLAGEIGEVRPIELQIVGTQLQTEKITTLEKYQKIGNKEKLVEKFLEDVIKDCGAENEQMVRLVLYLLTDENGIRPLKTRAELATQLLEESENLDLILNIFVASGLVLILPESPADRYQLVHDYLVEFIRQQQGNKLLVELAELKKKEEQSQAEIKKLLEEKLLAELTKEQEQRKLAEDQIKIEQQEKKILANAKLQADEQVKKGGERLKLSSGLAASLLVIAGIASVYGLNQFKETKISQIKQIKLQQKTQQLVSQTEELQQKSQQAEKNKQTAENNFKLAEQNTKKAQQNLLLATAKVEEVNKQAAILRHQNTGAELKIKTANNKVKAVKDKLKQVKMQQEKAENQAKQAQTTSVQANAAYLKSLSALKAADASKKEALLVTKLEQNGVNVLKQFQIEPLPSLVTAIQNGKALKTLVKDSPLEKYPTISPIYALNNILDNINERNQFKGHQGYVYSVSFSPDGKTIATASADRTARLWSLKGELLQEFNGHQGYVYSVSLSPDGKTIATASADRTARLWNLKGELLQEFNGHQGSVYSVSFSPDGKTIATASADRTARLWNLKGELLQEFKGHQGYVYSVSFSPDGKTIATASYDKTARLWNLKGELLQEFKGHQGSVYSVSFSPNGKTITTASLDNTARLWNLKGELLQEFNGHQGSVYSVSFSPDGKTIATTSLDKTARLWNLKGELLQEFKGHQEAVRGVSFSPDGKTITTASLDNTARLWNLQSKLLQEFNGYKNYVDSISFSPDGKTIATTSLDKTARLWNLKGELLQEFKGHQGYVLSVSFSPNGKTIATASEDKTARLWNLKGDLLQEFKGHRGYVLSVSLSPDGKTIATASADRTARLWNLKGELLQEFKGHQDYVLSVSFSPDGKTIATASADRTARLWNLKGELLQEFKGHQEAVRGVSFSPDGKTIATAGDKTVRLWNLKGELLQEFKGHQEAVYSVSFSPDGKTITTTSFDKTVRLWPVRNLDRLLVDGCDWLKYYLHNPNINLSPEERRLCDDV